MTEQNINNVLIIGGGPAGLAASLYTARANLNPLVIAGSPPGGQLMLTSDVENYPGFDSVMGPDLITKMREHTLKFNTQIKNENVMAVNFKQSPFEVTTVSGVYKAKAVIIAVGASALWLGLPNETRLRGHGVSACATCDGFFFRNKAVGVVGGGDTAAEEALFLTRFATKVYMFVRRDMLRASKIMQDRVTKHPKIEVVWTCQVEDVLGQDKVEGVKLKMQNGESRTQNLDGLFIAIGHKPDTDVFKDQIALDEKGYIYTTSRVALENIKQQTSKMQELAKKFDLTYQNATSVPGIFAAGDCVDFTYRQAGTASGMGIAAALDAERYLESSS